MPIKAVHMTNDPLYEQVFSKASHVEAFYDDRLNVVAFETVAEGAAFIHGLEVACELIGITPVDVENRPYNSKERE